MSIFTYYGLIMLLPYFFFGGSVPVFYVSLQIFTDYLILLADMKDSRSSQNPCECLCLCTTRFRKCLNFTKSVIIKFLEIRRINLISRHLQLVCIGKTEPLFKVRFSVANTSNFLRIEGVNQRHQSVKWFGPHKGKPEKKFTERNLCHEQLSKLNHYKIRKLKIGTRYRIIWLCANKQLPCKNQEPHPRCFLKLNFMEP